MITSFLSSWEPGWGGGSSSHLGLVCQLVPCESASRSPHRPDPWDNPSPHPPAVLQIQIPFLVARSVPSSTSGHPCTRSVSKQGLGLGTLQQSLDNICINCVYREGSLGYFGGGQSMDQNFLSRGIIVMWGYRVPTPTSSKIQPTPPGTSGSNSYLPTPVSPSSEAPPPLARTSVLLAELATPLHAPAQTIGSPEYVEA